MALASFARRVRWLLCAATILYAAPAHATEHQLNADFDGDGRHDRVAIDRRDPSVLHVWLSSTDATELIRSSRPLLRLAAGDLDGDNRPELIATDTSVAGLRVWKRDGHRGFRTYRRAPPRPDGVSFPIRASFDDQSFDFLAGLPGSPYTEQALNSAARAHAPPTDRRILLPRGAASLPHAAAFTPAAPRPPPALVT